MVLPRFETFDLVLPLAGSMTLPLSGDFVHILRAGGDLKLSIDGQVAFGKVGAGLRYKAPAGVMFNSLTFENLGVQAEDLRFAYGVGDFSDQRALPRPASIFSTFGGNAPPGRPIAAGAWAVLWLGGQTDRRAAIISASYLNTAPVILVAADLWAGEGIELLPGEKIVLETSAAIYARNDSGATQYVQRAELVD